MTYLDIRLEIDRMKGLYTISEMKEARESYNQYVQIIITEGELSPLERKTLFQVWDVIKMRIEDDE